MTPLTPYRASRWMERAAVAAMICTCTARIAAAQIEMAERASATVAGVHISVVADAWAGVPLDIGEIEPLLVTIDNRSTVPLRLRYEHFAAIGPEGDRQPALPPFDIRGTAWVDPYYLPGARPFSADRFPLTPHLERFYPGPRAFGGSFSYNPWYDSSYYGMSARVGLPTQDMLAQALPEGVVEPGGSVAGYLYLAGKPRRGRHARFVAALVNALTGEAIARVELPLEID